jgi:hypothetical protein
MNRGNLNLPVWLQKVAQQAETKISFLPASVNVKYEPYISFTHWGWSEYSKRVGGPPIDRSNCHQLKTIDGDNIGSGYLSAMSCKKLKKCINFLIYVSKFKILSPSEKQLSFGFTVNFITLTLPSAQQHSDQFIKRECLETFISYMKYHHSLWAYVWKAESQDNGNIHFHIVTNIFIDHKIIREAWNRIIEKFGYIEAYSSKMIAKFANGFIFDNTQKWINKKTGKEAIAPRSVQLQRMKQGSQSGWRNPNSTDVHAIKKVSNLGGYLATYMGKKDKLKKSCPSHLKQEFAIAEKDVTKMQLLHETNPEIFKRPITGQLWNSSKNLKISTISIKVTDDIRVSLSQMCTDIAKPVFSDRFVIVYRFLSGSVEKLTEDIGSLWGAFLSETFPQIVPVDS